MFENYREIAKAFREVADVLDELGALEDRMNNGEDVDSEMEAALGKLMIKMMKMEAMKNK